MTPTPFTNIAVSLSGGGYRATTFHLGTLSYLNEQDFQGKKLIEQVKVLSTISGGTLTGVMYAHKLAQGEDIVDCFKALHKLLREDKLIEEALGKLNNATIWKNNNKSRDVINAFSEVYNEKFYDKATFDELYKNDTHLSDIAFTGSEFTNGYEFRFQKAERARFGNHELSLPKDVSKEIRLADAAAASSCFPAGFEPMIMPKDFGNGENSPVNQEWKEKKYPVTGIMDGGILDNQGIEPVLYAEKRHKNRTDEAYIGTYIVSDVSGKKMKPYVVPKRPKGLNFLTIRFINIIAFILFFLSTFALFYFPLSKWVAVPIAMLMTVILIWALLLKMARNMVKSAVEKMFGPNSFKEIYRDFGVLLRTPLHILSYLVSLRVSSVVKMVSDIFLRRIRQLQVGFLFESDEWRYRTIKNDIYRLQDDVNPDFLHMTPELNNIVEAANKMPTTLWFSDAEKANNALDKLIIAGQITTCYNLVQYIHELIKGTRNHGTDSEGNKITAWEELTEQDQKQVEELQKKMIADLKKFEATPDWLVKKFLGNQAVA